MSICYKCDACGKTFENPGFYKTKKVDCINLVMYGIGKRTGDVVRSIDVCPDCLAAVVKTLEDRKEQSQLLLKKFTD